MTPSEKRIKDQIDRWLTSLDLHMQYAELNDLAYNRVQNWPVHDRPAKVVLDLAKQKTLELSKVLAARRNAGDAQFAEAMELMAFLVNLVGSQHVQRFIPLAEPPQQASTPQPAAPSKTPVATPIAPQSAFVAEKPVEKRVAPPAPPPSSSPQPKLTTISAQPSQQTKPAAPVTAPPVKSPAPPHVKNTSVPELGDAYVPQQKVNGAASRLDETGATREMPRLQRNPAANKRAAGKPSAKPEPKPEPASRSSGSNIEQLIIADAVRLTNWGRKWHELAESIARIADRPAIGEIRRILRAHRDEIQRRAAEPQS
jgi:hypothetical protein